MRRVLSGLLLLALAACGVVPRRVRPDDPRVRELAPALAAAAAERAAFTLLDSNAVWRLEEARGVYDRMLHVDGRTLRTIAFRRTAAGWVWIHEQEIFTGPRLHDTPDGRMEESLCLTYERERVSGYVLNQLHLTYRGDDPRLNRRQELTIEEVRPILVEWGYDGGGARRWERP